MKRFRNFRDPRFALTTLQNPTWEVRTRAELIQAAQDALTRQPDAAELPFARRPAAPVISPPATTIATPVAAAPLAEPQPRPHLQSQSEPEPEPERQLEPHPEPEPLPNQPAASDLVPIDRPLPKIVTKLARKAQRKPKPRAKPVQRADVLPSGNAAHFVAKTLDRLVTKASRPHRDEHSAPASMDRHDRKCAICHHPERADLEEDFLNWCNADLLRKRYKLPNYRTIYRHARATGLYQRRRENLRFAAEILIEDVDQSRPGPDTILRAINTCARLNDRGQWVEPVKHVVVSSGGQIASFAPSFHPAPVPDPHQSPPEKGTPPQFPADVRISTDEPDTAIPNQRPGD
jgi:hypothetical protein